MIFIYLFLIAENMPLLLENFTDDDTVLIQA